MRDAAFPVKLLAIGWLFTASACSETIPIPDINGVDVPGVEVDATSGVDGDVSAPETAAEVGTDTEAEVVVVPGGIGSPCSENSDCNSAYCVQSAQGQICTKQCIEDCPNGYDCQNVITGGDAVFLCMPAFPRLCYPCNANDDCLIPGVDAPARCVSFGDAGNFCGGECTLGGSDCPSDHVCINAADVEGNNSAQCVPVDGNNQVAVCSCTASAVSDAASTSCRRTNGFGTCEGDRACGVGGLSSCTATEPQAEVCNGVDDNCDGITDPEGTPGCTVYFFDDDDDGAGIASDSRCLCAPEGGHTASVGGDCDDTNDAVFPDATELCNGTDDNCSGGVDEGFPDTDNDQVADCLDLDIDGDGDPNDSDCEPLNSAVHTSALEICDGIDNNCNTLVDEDGSQNCQTYYRDLDEDNYGLLGDSQCLCQPTGLYTSIIFGDCNDNDAAVYPNAPEICDEQDNNCNGNIDEGVKTTFYLDNDGDNYGGTASLEACSPPQDYVAAAGDCNDFNMFIYPTAPEQCNELDDDCNGATELVTELTIFTSYKDNDGDGHAPLGALSQEKCDVPLGWTLAQDVDGDGNDDWDCDDSQVTVYPGAPTICGDSLDNNCDNVVDRLCFTDCDGAWPFEQEFKAGMGATLVDLNGDGNYETVATSTQGFAILDTMGAPLYDFSSATTAFANGLPVFADIDQATVTGSEIHTLEVLASHGSYPRFYKLQSNGTVDVYENTDAAAFSYVTSDYLVSDLDRDGIPEFVAATACSPEAAKFFKFDPGTETISVASSILDPDGTCSRTNGRLLTDLDGDGTPEFIFGTGFASAAAPDGWSGNIYALAFDDTTTMATSSYCADCFDTDNGALFKGGVRTILRVDDEIRTQIRYYATNEAGQSNTAEDWSWRYDLNGAPIAGQPTEAYTLYTDNTDVNGDGTLDSASEVTEVGLWDLNGDGFPDRIYRVNNELRLGLWSETTNGFVENVASRRSLGTSILRSPSVWDIDDDNRAEVVVTNSGGSVYCQKLGPATWNKYESQPPRRPRAYRTNQDDNYEPNDGDDIDADGVPDHFARIPSALTARGDFYSYLTSATDEDFFHINTKSSSDICMRSPPGHNFSLHVYSMADKLDAGGVAGTDGLPDGLVWEDASTDETKCFNGSSMVPTRAGEYFFIIAVKSADGTFSKHVPYWIEAVK